ncbi:MAG: hypothetical protein AB1861_05695 [Cyanobacteriota bacterium]
MGNTICYLTLHPTRDRVTKAAALPLAYAAMIRLSQASFSREKIAPKPLFKGLVGCPSTTLRTVLTDWGVSARRKPTKHQLRSQHQ